MAEVRRVAGTDPLARELVAAMVEELGGLERSPLALAALLPPGGGFVVPSENGRAVGAGRAGSVAAAYASGGGGAP
jgi:hypothetical protein